MPITVPNLRICPPHFGLIWREFAVRACAVQSTAEARARETAESGQIPQILLPRPARQIPLETIKPNV